MMQVLDWDTLSAFDKNAALTRPKALLDADIQTRVQNILQEVRTGGDAALRAYTKQFDGVEITDIKVAIPELKAAWDGLPQVDKSALQTAKSNIEKFHAAQVPQNITVETMPGVVCRREPRAIDSAGLYVPGGSAPLVSTLMMLAIPAGLAGVPQRIVVTPPSKNGTVNPHILAAAYLCDIQDVFMVGGAQAIAALAYGTETIPKCAKIFGPGNAYVAQAKALVSSEMGGPAIDLPAGPSEAMVLADDEANAIFVAADLLSQAEHDALAQVICVCRSSGFAKKLTTEIERQLADLPRRDIARHALENGKIFIAPDAATMIEISNAYAPEHLIVQIDQPEKIASSIRNAGSIFLGPWTPESVGDYASGTNHTLPTYGAARAYSGVTLESFIKYISIQTLTREGLETLGPCVERLAQIEGLDAHKRAISLRLQNKNGAA